MPFQFCYLFFYRFDMTNELIVSNAEMSNKQSISAVVDMTAAYASNLKLKRTENTAIAYVSFTFSLFLLAIFAKIYFQMKHKNLISSFVGFSIIYTLHLYSRVYIDVRKSVYLSLQQCTTTG